MNSSSQIQIRSIAALELCRQNGLSISDAAEILGVSRQRAHQIVKKLGLIWNCYRCGNDLLEGIYGKKACSTCKALPRSIRRKTLKNKPIDIKISLEERAA
jgi:predicted DNA-binding protein YlxM (UPF0122 family)